MEQVVGLGAMDWMAIGFTGGVVGIFAFGLCWAVIAAAATSLGYKQQIPDQAVMLSVFLLSAVVRLYQNGFFN